MKGVGQIERLLNMPVTAEPNYPFKDFSNEADQGALFGSA